MAKRTTAYEMANMHSSSSQELEDAGSPHVLAGKPAASVRFWNRLRKLPPMFNFLMAILFIESIAYFQITISLQVYLHTVFGMSDTASGDVYATWGIIIFVISFPAGLVIDSIPIKASFLIGSVSLAISRIVFAISPFEGLTLAALFVPMAVGQAFIGQIFPIVINRYFEEGSRLSTFAFSVSYAVMNAGAVFAGWSTDLSLILGDYNGYHLLFTTASALTVINYYLCVAYESPPPREQAPKRTKSASFKGVSLWYRMRLTCKVTVMEFWLKAKELFMQPMFWKLTTFTLFLTPVRNLFVILNAFFPSYMKRVYTGYPYGTVLSINPILIIFLTPAMSIVTDRYLSTYGWIVVGTLISSLSSLWLWLWPSESLVPLICFVVFFTIGESIYSARAGQYIVEKSPAGKKGAYSALTSFPASIGHAIAGAFSGDLLARFCPDYVAYDEAEEIAYRRECSMSWFYIFIGTIPSALLLLVSARFLNADRSRHEGKNPGLIAKFLMALRLA